ncbi:3'-5' RNA exonuclease complex component [Thecaphora frezii]
MLAANRAATSPASSLTLLNLNLNLPHLLPNQHLHHRHLHASPLASRRPLPKRSSRAIPHQSRPDDDYHADAYSSAHAQHEHRPLTELERQNRIAQKTLTAAALGNPPPRAQHGSDPYAGWTATPGPSSRRNLGRPKLDAAAAHRRRLPHNPQDVDSLLGPYTAAKLTKPLQTGEAHDDALLHVHDFLYPRRDIQNGDYVEVRKSGTTAHGIVMPLPDDEQPDAAKSDSATTAHRLNTNSDLFVLVSSGNIVLYRTSDVMIQIPRLVDPSLTCRGAVRTRDHIVSSNSIDSHADSDGSHDPHAAGAGAHGDPVDGVSLAQEPIDEARFEVRAAICNKLRILERQKEKEIQRLLPAFRSMFLDDADSVVSSKSRRKTALRADIRTGTISTYEAARLMNRCVAPTVDGKRQPAPLTASTILAAHTLLMNTPSHFIVDTLSHRTSQLYTCRSLEERRTLQLLARWVQSPPGSAGQRYIDDFCRRAAKVRAWSAKHPSRPEGEPHHVATDGLDVEWSEQDRIILSFLEDSLASRREVQEDTHGSIAMEILKRARAHIRAKPHPTGKPDPELDEAAALLLFPKTGTAGEAAVDAHELAILSDLGGEISAGADLQHALVTRFLKEVGYLSPWSNAVLLDATFRNLVSGESEGRPEPHAPKATSPANDDGAAAAAERYELGHDAEIESKRHDFGRDLAVYVIDDAGAFELDDGISIQPVAAGEGDAAHQFWVHVHVADPTASMRPDDALGMRASRRFSTLYFPEARWALLPDDFVNAGAGLRTPPPTTTGKGQGQRVMTFSAKVDARNGQVDDYRIQPAWVHDVRVVSYDEANVMLQSGTGGDLAQLQRVAKALCAARVRGTAMNAWRRNVSVSLSPLPLPDTASTAHRHRPQFYDGFPSVQLSVSGEPDGTTASQFMVSECMLLAGRVAGAFGHERDVALPYRLQPRPDRAEDVARILSMREGDTGSVDFEAMLAHDLSLPAGRYSDRSGEHFSLGICTPEASTTEGVLAHGGYLRATSPLRRYPDMVAHWQIKNSLLDRPPLFDRSELVGRLGEFERAEVLVKQLQRAAERAWVLRAVQLALDRQRAGQATQHDEKLLGPHDATALLTDVRVSPNTLGARVRVQIAGLGVPADLIWQETARPEKGKTFKVKVVATVSAGLRSSIVVRRV